MNAAVLSSEPAIREYLPEVYSRVEHLAKSLWLGRFAWDRRMAMYSAYFDESGTPDDSQFMVVAGAVADVDQWRHFEREWELVLAPLGTKLFHAVDFESGAPPFGKLTERERDELFAKLVGIVCRRVERSCAGTVNMHDYRIANEKYVLAEQYGFPYPSAARCCMAGVEDWADRFSVDVNEILFFFEDGAKHKGQLEWIAERDGIPVPMFRKKSDVTALQAADLIAWCIHLSLVRETPSPRYERALARIMEITKVFRQPQLNNPDRFATLLQIPLRDQSFKYECKTVRIKGQRQAALIRRPRSERSQFRVNRQDVIPKPLHMPVEEMLEIARRYDDSVRLEGER